MQKCEHNLLLADELVFDSTIFDNDHRVLEMRIVGRSPPFLLEGLKSVKDGKTERSESHTEYLFIRVDIGLVLLVEVGGFGPSLSHLTIARDVILGLGALSLGVVSSHGLKKPLLVS
jgi:hypothetical protein